MGRREAYRKVVERQGLQERERHPPFSQEDVSIKPGVGALEPLAVDGCCCCCRLIRRWWSRANLTVHLRSEDVRLAPFVVVVVVVVRAKETSEREGRGSQWFTFLFSRLDDSWYTVVAPPPVRFLLQFTEGFYEGSSRPPTNSLLHCTSVATLQLTRLTSLRLSGKVTPL